MRRLFDGTRKAVADPDTGEDSDTFVKEPLPPCSEKEKYLVLDSLLHRKRVLFQQLYNQGILTPDEIKKKINTWLKTDYGKLTLEPHYSKIKPRIMIEQFLTSSFEFPIEYKLHVFNGTVKFLYVVTNRGKDIRYTLYDRHWKPFDGAQFNGWKKSDLPINQPRQFDQMLTIAEKLGQSFPFVRVDLYAMLDKIYVSELTFTPAKGTLRLDDDQTDFIIGEWLNVHEKK
jgi:hypothetical protein